MRHVIFLICTLLLLSACQQQVNSNVPVEDILNGPSEVAKAPEPKQEPQPEPKVETKTPEATGQVVAEVVEPKEEPEVTEKSVEEPKESDRGELTHIDAAVKATNTLVTVWYENGQEDFTIKNTNKELVIGFLVGKYDLSQSTVETLTEFTGLPEEKEEEKEEPKQVTQTKVVKVQGYRYTPEVLTIPVNTAVLWTHDDLSWHTVTSSDGRDLLDSGMMTRGDTYTYNFFKAGTYEYASESYPSMRGKIVVE